MGRSMFLAEENGAGSAHVHRFQVMGVTASIAVLGANESVARVGADRVCQLERRWSRFERHSDISRLNAARGAWTAVSPDTIALVTWMVAAHRETNGSFDPTLLPATVALGDASSRTGSDHVTVLSPGAVAGGAVDAIDIDADLGMVRLPPAMALDPGGIAKGLAADMVSMEIMRSSASGVCVNIGGDLRCAGDPGPEGGWLVHVMSGDRHDVRRWTVSVRDGGVATSSTLARRWRDRLGERRHHILDPLTSCQLREDPDDLQLASVIAQSAAWAEVHTKVLLVEGWRAGCARLESRGLAAAALTHGGRELTNHEWERFSR